MFPSLAPKMTNKPNSWRDERDEVMAGGLRLPFLVSQSVVKPYGLQSLALNITFCSHVHNFQVILPKTVETCTLPP